MVFTIKIFQEIWAACFHFLAYNLVIIVGSSWTRCSVEKLYVNFHIDVKSPSSLFHMFAFWWTLLPPKYKHNNWMPPSIICKIVKNVISKHAEHLFWPQGSFKTNTLPCFPRKWFQPRHSKIWKKAKESHYWTLGIFVFHHKVASKPFSKIFPMINFGFENGFEAA